MKNSLALRKNLRLVVARFIGRFGSVDGFYPVERRPIYWATTLFPLVFLLAPLLKAADSSDCRDTAAGCSGASAFSPGTVPPPPPSAFPPPPSAPAMGNPSASGFPPSPWGVAPSSAGATGTPFAPGAPGLGPAVPSSSVPSAPATDSGPSRIQVVTRRYPSGELLSERRLYDGQPDGLTKEYYKNGQVMNEWNFSRGVLSGESVSYYRTGDVMTRWHYKKGVLDGDVKHYLPREILKSVETYKDGVLQKSKDYNDK